jgi:hypothetical protein
MAADHEPVRFDAVRRSITTLGAVRMPYNRVILQPQELGR